MPPVLQYDLEVKLVPNGVPVPVTATHGRARIVLEAAP